MNRKVVPDESKVELSITQQEVVASEKRPEYQLLVYAGQRNALTKTLLRPLHLLV
jgi:hypothetical protein